MAVLCEQVQNGVDLLNEEEQDKSEWPLRIDLSTLDLGSLRYCIIGQLHGDYAEGCYALGLDEFNADEYGFAGDPDMLRLFEKEWEEYIKERQADLNARKMQGRLL